MGLRRKEKQKRRDVLRLVYDLKLSLEIYIIPYVSLGLDMLQKEVILSVLICVSSQGACVESIIISGR